MFQMFRDMKHSSVQDNTFQYRVRNAFGVLVMAFMMCWKPEEVYVCHYKTNIRLTQRHIVG